MISSDIENRIIKYLVNEANTEDMDFLSEWISIKENECLFEEYVKKHFEITIAMNEPDIVKIKKNLLKEIKKDNNIVFRHKIRPIMKYAAVGLLFLVLGYFFRQDSFTDDRELLIPKDESITITLDDGIIETLNTNEFKEVKNANGDVIGSQDKTKLTYQGNTIPQSGQASELVYNTLNVPYGKRFDVVLSDGTHVFLNSGTSLRYPVQFIEGLDRKVFLKGEAYFDVAKDKKHPFVVNASELAIEVLGTKFNVSHYPEDDDINTVLVEGSVELYEKDVEGNVDTTLLEPGFKAEWSNTNHDIDIKNVDTKIYTAWIEGKLIFRNTSFRQIRLALERKYNIKIRNNNENLDEQLFDATFDIETINEVLESFGKSYSIEYKIDNNIVIIK